MFIGSVGKKPEGIKNPKEITKIVKKVCKMCEVCVIVYNRDSVESPLQHGIRKESLVAAGGPAVLLARICAAPCDSLGLGLVREHDRSRLV